MYRRCPSISPPRRKLERSIPKDQLASRPAPDEGPAQKLAARLATLAPEELSIIVETGLMEASRMYELSLRGGLDKDNRMYALEQSRGRPKGTS